MDSCSLPDSSAPPSSSSAAAAVCGPEGGDSGAVEEEEGGAVGGEEAEAEEERWRRLAGDVIELSDEDDFLEDDEDDDLVCIENGGGQVSLYCKACAAPLPPDAASVRSHADGHVTEAGHCRLCGASFPDRGAAGPHALAHVGVRLFTCDMCQLQFCSRSRLLRHHRQAAAGYTLPPGALANPGAALQCAACSKTLIKDFQTVKDHLLSHVSGETLTCGVCQRPLPSLCSLRWHALAHLALPVFCCPHCARCFAERPLLDRHVAAHGEEAAEELHCFLCPRTFSSASAFQDHLGLHGEGGEGGGAPGWPGGKRKAERPLDCPPSSCSSSSSPGDGLLRMSGLGPGAGFFQGPVPGALTDGQDGGGGGVRGKWYHCRYCGKRFAHSGEFTYHLRIHTGEKPYQCKVCLRFFRGRSTMICHLKTHAGALMYRCTVCGLFFSTLKLVAAHMELHQDQLPPDFNIEQTFMYNDHSKEPLAPLEA